LPDSEIKRAIIELEYQDILEQRNGLLLAYATVPIGFLAILLPTMTQGWLGLVIGAVIIGASVAALELFRRRLNSDIQAKRNELLQLLKSNSKGKDTTH
jgi:predicted DNA repair protein MutK